MNSSSSSGGGGQVCEEGSLAPERPNARCV
jgi:hypothetical protein